MHKLERQHILVGVQVDDCDAQADQVIEQPRLARRRAKFPHHGLVVGDQADPRALALDQRIGALGRGVPDVFGAVQQRLEISGSEDFGARLRDAVEQTLRQVERGRQCLGVREVLTIPHADVSECSPVVDVDQTLHEDSSARFECGC